ncbi:PIN domain-containing protein [Rhodomicrobium vannielii ATCC 17100]|uniref:PIN domain-containing protein n=1 Tax=Rhodomicrobium vannielii TaxID=1069 RepID=UPI001918FD80|nr:PIN domain-containing protein [Rhodomicrobium vannielii]MBJ7534494.1 PIN domain-containing protein [Rhodomicrobium vannielii ATCC 17100]
MTVECFLDTNILLYAASKNPAHRSKKTIAIRLIGEEQFGLSAQVLQEFYVNATRKTDFDMQPALALEWIENLEEFACVPTDVALVKAAAVLSTRYRISYWDAAIIAAAEALGANTIYTEDLSHGQAYGSVTVENPFLPAPSAGGFHDTEQALLLKD